MAEQDILIEQRSEDWYNIRKAKITSSEIWKIMGESKSGGLTDVAKNYLLEKVSEHFGGYSAPLQGAALDWGTQLEDTAAEIYQATTGLEVEKCSFIQVNPHYGGSPDRRVKPDGVLEIKCPYISANHFKYGLISSPKKFKKTSLAYYYQCVSHMNVTGAKWCDFVSFDPRVYVDYMLFTYRLHRDEQEIEDMNNKIKLASDFLQETIEKLPKCAINSLPALTPSS